MRLSVLTRAAVVLAALSFGSSAFAAGIYIPGVGPVAQGRAGAVVAKSDDPTAIAHNVAGLVHMKGTHIYVGANFVNMSLTFQRAGTYDASEFNHDYEGLSFPEVRDESSPALGFAGFQAVPTIVVVTDFGLDIPLRLAAGLFAGHGYPARKFRESYPLAGEFDPAPAPQRYDVIEQDVESAKPSIAVAYGFTDWLWAGARFSSGFTRIQSRSTLYAVRNFEEAPEKDGTFSLNVNDSFTPNFGLSLMFMPHEQWHVGLNYDSPTAVHATGFGTAALGSSAGLPGVPDTIEPLPPGAIRGCGEGGTLASVPTCIDLGLPQTLTAGVRWRYLEEGKERGDIEFDIKWENWSNASDFTVTVDGRSGLTGIPLKQTIVRHGFRDAVSLRLGGHYLFDFGHSELALRAGMAYDTGAAPNQFTRVDIDGTARVTLAMGASYTIWRLKFDVGFGGAFGINRTVEGCKLPSGPSNESPGCDGSGLQTPVEDRTSPDPGQPLLQPEDQDQSPFNAGSYKTSYALFSFGVSTWF